MLEAIKTIINNAVNAFKNTNWLSLGSDIIKGLVNGILGGINSVIKAIKKVCNSIFDGIKNFFSIFSPSHKMRDEIGKHLPSGIAVGYERAMPEATKDMIDTTDDGFQKLKASAKTIGGEVAYDSVMPLPNTSTLGRDDLIDYDRLANSMSKVNMSVEMDKQRFISESNCSMTSSTPLTSSRRGFISLNVSLNNANCEVMTATRGSSSITTFSSTIVFVTTFGRRQSQISCPKIV